MAHRTQIDGTAYQIVGGKTLVDGTAYAVKSGKTCVDGTEQTINFQAEVYVLTTKYGFSAAPSYGSGSITYKGETYTLDANGIGPYQIEVVQGDSVTISLTGRDWTDTWSIPTITVSLNGTVVASAKADTYRETVLTYTYTPQADATIEFIFGDGGGYYYSQAEIVEAG